MSDVRWTAPPRYQAVSPLRLPHLPALVADSSERRGRRASRRRDRNRLAAREPPTAVRTRRDSIQGEATWLEHRFRQPGDVLVARSAPITIRCYPRVAHYVNCSRRSRRSASGRRTRRRQTPPRHREIEFEPRRPIPTTALSRGTDGVSRSRYPFSRSTLGYDGAVRWLRERRCRLPVRRLR